MKTKFKFFCLLACIALCMTQGMKASVASGTTTSEFEKGFTLNVTVPSGTHAVYVSGNFNNWTDFVKMDQVNETTYTKPVIAKNIEQIEYKYYSGPDLEYEELHSDGSRMDNRMLADSIANDYVALWKAVYGSEKEYRSCQ